MLLVHWDRRGSWNKADSEQEMGYKPGQVTNVSLIEHIDKQAFTTHICIYGQVRVARKERNQNTQMKPLEAHGRTCKLITERPNHSDNRCLYICFYKYDLFSLCKRFVKSLQIDFNINAL